MTDHADLLRRLERGESSAAIDGDFALALGTVPKDCPRRLDRDDCERLGWNYKVAWFSSEDEDTLWMAPSVSSVDAMLKLRDKLFPEDKWELLFCERLAPKPSVKRAILESLPDRTLRVNVIAPTFAHALAAALLRAHMQEQSK